MRVQGRKPGQLAHDVAARAEALPEARAQSVVQVEAYANLTLQVTPRDNPLELGRDTIYEVRVQNQGNAPATNVQVKLEMPTGLTPGHMQGPTIHRTQGRLVTFEPIANLPPRTQAVFHVGVSAQAAGDLRVRAQLTSDQHRQPITRDVPMRVYRD